MKQERKNRIAFITFIAIAALATVAYLTYIIVEFALNQKIDNMLLLICTAALILCLGIMVFCISITYSYRKEILHRREDNKRVFGISTYFNTKSSFTSAIYKKAQKVAYSQAIITKASETTLAQKIGEAKDEDVDVEALRDAIQTEVDEGNGRRLPHGAIIALSLFADLDTYQYYQTEQIKGFYATCVSYFETLLNTKENKHRTYAGFESNVFYLYFAYRNVQVLNKFLAKVEADIYQLFEQSKISVNMHPAFGIYKIDGKEKDVYKMVENSYVSLKAAINSYQVFVNYDEKLTDSSSHSDELEQEIRRGLEKNEFKVFYQGKFDLSTQKFVGAEALIRWQHPEKGLFNPSSFIGESEKSGLIHLLDFYVFDQVCKDLGDWKKRGRRMLPVSVNFSSYDFYRPDFVESILSTIEKNGVAPNFIEIEITESSAAANYYYVMSVLKRLKDNNIQILMDDFGTGFSSLGNLKKYPISALKIDKSFIDEMLEDAKSKQIVATIIDLCRSLGLQSIAEGVQTEAQVKTLKDLHCNQIQGYYYSKPISKKDFEIFLSTNQFEKKGILL